MASDIDITIDVAFPSNFASLLMAMLASKCVAATEAGAKVLQDESERIIDSWQPDSKAVFEVTDPIIDATSVTRHLKAHGAIWHYVNEGTKAVNISGTYMRFPLNMPFVPFTSYSPKSTGGGGERLGPDGVQFAVHNRYIRPFRLDQKAVAAARDRVVATMRTFF